MKLVYTDGCICTGLTIDGKDYNNLNLGIEKKREIAHKLLESLDEGDLDNEILDLIQTSADYKIIGHCEECGDTIYEWTTEI
mgnify:CR=1 FL=1